jgi:2',3'-cyclic-nucleotide 2'-phosphodiesterase
VNSILGRTVEPIVNRFISNLPVVFPVARGDVRLCGALVSIDEATGHAVKIARVNELISATTSGETAPPGA